MSVRRMICTGFAAAVVFGVARAQVPQPAAEPGSVPEAQSPAPVAATPASRGPVRVSGGVIAGLRISGENPVYPPDAKAQGISGAVVMHAVIGKDGTVEKLTVVSGNSILADAALDAVKTWTYKPYLLNGEPTEVDTTVTVNFHLDTPAPQGGMIGSYAPPREPLPPLPPLPPGRLRICSGVVSGQKIAGGSPQIPAAVSTFGWRRSARGYCPRWFGSEPVGSAWVAQVDERSHGGGQAVAIQL